MTVDLNRSRQVVDVQSAFLSRRRSRSWVGTGEWEGLSLRTFERKENNLLRDRSSAKWLV